MLGRCAHTITNEGGLRLSARATLADGDDFHLYREMADGTIRLEMDMKRCSLHAIPQVMIDEVEEVVDIAIPPHILKAILDQKDQLMKSWKHLFDDPVIGMLNSMRDENNES